jgi:RND family efflux transporter MFP subunit
MKSYLAKIIIPFSLLVSGCNQPPVEREERGDVINVSLEAVRSIQYTLPVRSTGLLGTGSEMKLSFKTGGIIRKIYVNEGDAVNRGKVLAELDLSEVKAQVKQATIGMEKAERDLIRAENLYRDSVVTLEQYQDAQSALELAKAGKKVADFNLIHSTIKAPESGKIQKIMAEPSEMIAPGYPVILFASTEGDWVVRAAVTDKDVVRISVGDSAVVTMDAFPGEQFPAMVIEIGTIADPYTGSYEVEMAIYRPLKQFRTGFFSRATVYPASKESYLVVPLEALLDAQDNLAGIYVWKEGKVGLKKIRTGLIIEEKVVVLEGLNEGDLVVTDGARFIRKGSVVKPVNQKEGSRP